MKKGVHVTPKTAPTEEGAEEEAALWRRREIARNSLPRKGREGKRQLLLARLEAWG
jgi:hypothetical protein